jgi:hypothetical protein
MFATRYLPFVGRLMIGLPFAMSGSSKLGAYSATTGMISAVGLPFPPLAFAVAVARRWPASHRRLSRPLCGRGSCPVLTRDGDIVSHQLRGPEPDDPLPQKRDDGGWASADRGIRRRCAQHRQSAQDPRAGFKPCSDRLKICDGVLARSLDRGLQALSRKPLSKTPMVLAPLSE